MEKEEPDVLEIDVKTKESDKLLLTGDEYFELVDWAEKCPVGNTYFSKEDRLCAVHQSLGDNPLFTGEEHKAVFPSVIIELKRKRRKDIYMVETEETDTVINNTNVLNNESIDKHLTARIAKGKRRSKRKQKENNTDSYKKSKTDKVDLRANHNLKRDCPGSIPCPLANKCCDRENHKDRTNHKVCPLGNLYMMHKGMCLHIIQCEWQFAPGFEL